MALVSVIRRWYFREGLSIREITRRTKLSRNTNRKYLKDGQLEPRYPQRKSSSKLDPYVEMLASWLDRESTRGRKHRRNLLKRPGGDREMVEILSLVLHHDEDAVVCAVELAIDSGTISKPHILNLLSRLLESQAPPRIDTPPHLTLAEEPKANVTRYDNLRGRRHVG